MESCKIREAIRGVHPKAALYDAMNETIAWLHGFDPAAIGLSDFGRPEGYVARRSISATR